ncbi:MAG: hypothetical protein ACTSQG_06080, partial [Promethearchaeota archaeon]
PLDFLKDLNKLAIKAYYLLKNLFSIKIKDGIIPVNFIHYPIRKKDKFKKSPTCSYGNCFSLGSIYGLSALYQWIKNSSIRDTLIGYLNPILNNAQIKNGISKGAFFDTYFKSANTWTTGRVQFKEGGFSDWIPYKGINKKRGYVGGLNLIENLNLLKRDFLLRKAEFLKFIIWANKLARMSIPFMKLKINKPVIYPAYTGQFAYFLLQLLIESEGNNHFLSLELEKKLRQSLELAANFLLKTQKENSIWDHELFIDGKVFWKKETLACIFPATFLILWGKITKKEEYLNAGLGALKKCNVLHNRNEYYGMYFETNLLINQYDLVTCLACIKCYCKLYEAYKLEEYLKRAKKTAWHIISMMWSNISDSKGNNITGGLLVTTRNSMGFPVIGGSELCQTFETFCELSFYEKKFLIFAKALLGYCLKFLIREGKKSLGIYEIIFGYNNNWSTSHSADFASYASGPFIRGLFLYSILINSRSKKE